MQNAANLTHNFDQVELGQRSTAGAPIAMQTANVKVDINSLREYLFWNHEAFIRLVLAEELGEHDVIPDFHIAGFRLMVSDETEDPNNARIAIAWPRDHAKTTLAKVATVYRLVYGLSRFPLYLSNTSPVAAAASRDIIDFLTSDRIQSVYGDVTLEIDTRAKGQFQGTIRDFDGSVRNKFIILSLGAGQQVRGTNRSNRRPDYLIVDDLESAEEAETNKLGYEQLKTWFYGTLRKALATGNNKIVQIGNYVTAKSILGDHIASPYWISVRLSAFNAKGQPLWPQRWTIEALRIDFLEYLHAKRIHVWLAEMLNLPFSDSAAGIKPDNLRLAAPISPGDPRILLRCITCDPAISTNIKRADSCVIAVHVLVRDHSAQAPYWQLAEISSEKGRGPYATYNDMVALALKWHVRAIGIESEAYQEALIHIAEHEAARAGYWHFKFCKLTTMKRSKASRIIAWSEALNSDLYRLSHNHLGILTQLLQYDVHSDTNVDDEIDCCAYILHMIKNFLGEMATAVQPPQAKGTLTPYD